MRAFKCTLTVCLLALFVFSQSVSAAPVGRVLYRQSFSAVTDAANAGIVKGTDGADAFHLYVEDDALVADTLSDRRAYTVFPYELPSDDCTVELSFSFERLDASNAYLAVMLTSRGAEPDNITAIPIRASGDCEGFGALGEELVGNIVSGERIDVKIPIRDGDYYELTVSCGGVSETLSRMTVGGIPKGRIGFALRNAAVRIYELAVVNGIDYSARSGKYSSSDTWSDSRPYRQAAADSETFAAPQTFDGLYLYAAAAALSAFGGKLLLDKLRYIG